MELRTCIKLCLITLVCFLEYYLSLDGEFVFDDSQAIVGNNALRENASIWSVFRNDFWGSAISDSKSHKSYRPLTVLTFMLNKYLDGDYLVPYNFKATNLILHTICCYLVFATFELLFRPIDNIDNDITNKDIVSGRFLNEPFLASLIFAAHPIHVESVAGIVGRADILAAIFFFLTILIYHKASNATLDDSTSTTYAYILYFSFITTTLVSVLCKETGITTLIICASYELTCISHYELVDIGILFRKRTPQTNGKSQNKEEEVAYDEWEYETDTMFCLVMRLALLFSVTVIIVVGRLAVMNFEPPTFQEVDNPAGRNNVTLTRVLTYNYLYFLNFVLLVWPHWLCFDWSMGCIPLLKSIFDYRIIFIIFFYTFLGLIVYRVILNRQVARRKRRLLVIALIIMIVPFLPGSNLITPVGFVLAERILYIPSAGFCMMVAIGYSTLLTCSTTFQKVAPFCVTVVMICFIFKTVHRAHEWKNEYLLFTTGVNVCPLNAKIHYNIGSIIRNQKIAESEYREALRLHPKYYQAMNNFANLLKDQKRYNEAETLFYQALTLKSDFATAWNNLGIVLSNLKKFKGAEEAYWNALKYRKNYPDCYYNLGNLHVDQNKNELAIEAWINATLLNPKHYQAWSNILALLDNTGQIDRALDLAPKVLEVLPNSAPIHFNLGNLYGKKGNFEKAEEHFLQAIANKGDDAPAMYYANFGVLYHRWKKNDLAERMYLKALELSPTMTSAEENLKMLYRRPGNKKSTPATKHS